MISRRLQGRAEPQTTPQRDRWMVSYLDMVTILLVFFVAAAAKTLAPGEKVAAAPPPVVVKPVARPMEPARDETREKLEQAGIEARREPRGLTASVPQAVLFAPGDDRIAEQALPLLDRLGAVLQAIPNRVIVVGHADSIPIHSRRFGNNWELSVARGMRMLELLSQRYQIDEKRLSVSGDGSNHPADSNDTAEGRAVNRRVELVILDEPAAPESGAEAITNPAPAAD